MGARMIAVLEMHAHITVCWELGSKQTKQNWSWCYWSVWQMPSLPGN